MIPVAMREHDGFDTAKIDTQSRAIVFDCKFHRAGIEKDSVTLSTAGRFDERQSMIGTTLALAGQLPHTGSHQCGPFKGYIRWSGGQAVRNIVDQDLKSQPIDRLDDSHGGPCFTP